MSKQEMVSNAGERESSDSSSLLEEKVRPGGLTFVESTIPRDIVLIYCGYDNAGPRNWEKDTLLYYAGYMGSSGEIKDVMFDSFLMMYRKSSRGRLFETSPSFIPTDKTDWLECLDRFFMPDFQLHALDAATSEVAHRLDLPYKSKVILTLPYPDVRQENFGVIPDKSESLDFRLSDTVRLNALRWYIDEAIDRWNRAEFTHLKLAGFYWFNEGHSNLREKIGISEDDAPHDDFNVMKGVSEIIHSRKIDGTNLKVFWIPYNPYGTRYLDFCKKWLTEEPGYRVDYLMIQPNYFFKRWNKSIDDLRQIIHNAKSIGAGVEIELNENILTEPDLPQRLMDYLGEVRKTGDYYIKTSIGYYQGLSTLYKAANNPAFRYIYDEVYRFISDRR